MTDRRGFKKRVRDRQAQTGENYTTARAQLLSRRPAPRPAVPVVEMIDASDQARLLGLRCAVLIAHPVLEQLELVRVVGRVRDALIACEGDPHAERMRTIVLHGGPLPPRRAAIVGDAMVAEARRFYARARAGIGGFDARGSQLVIHVGGAAVMCALSTRINRAAPLSLEDCEVVLIIELVSDEPELAAL